MISLTLCCSLIAIFILSRIVKLRDGLRKVGNTPGMRVIFAPVSLPGGIFPLSRLNPGLAWQWLWRNKVYPLYGSETISIVPLFGPPYLYTSSLEVARQALSTKGSFEKAADASQGVLEFGENLFTANGAEWRRHRRIMGPAFTNDTYSMVWEETALAYREMTAAEGWDEKEAVVVQAVNPLTTKMALIVLSRCGFGNPLPWKPATRASDVMNNFGEALEVVSESFITRLLIPTWMYKLPIKGIQRIDQSYKALSQHIHNLINTQRSGGEHAFNVAAKRDVLSLMIRASESEEKLAMTDEEMTGNVFFLLFAGHETMAHIWDATIGFLALYEDIQEDIVKHILAVVPAGSPITFTDSPKLDKVLACFLEAARLFPAGFILTRDTVENVVLNTYDDNGINGHIALEKGVRVAIDMVGIHYNPRHFPDPEEYRPSRWYGAPEETLSMFSIGSRACIGRRFATTEACCFLAHMMREWRFEIMLQPGETRPEWRKRILSAKPAMTLGVGNVPVRLIRR